MDNSRKKSESALPLSQIRQAPVPTIADQVFLELQQRILRLELPPGTKISETEVGNKMGVSRQPVREAFKRLAKLGFLIIRPQSSSTVSLISEEAVMRARYIRSALEIQTCRTACENKTKAGLAVLQSLLDDQQAAITANDRSAFHALDDEFHHQICVLAGVGYVWDLIQESKAHMDRIRMLSLNTSTQRFALQEHIDIFTAISEGNADEAAAAINKHLSRIVILIDEIKAGNHSWFTDHAT